MYEPQYIPCMVKFLTNAMLTGSFGITPDAKPMTSTCAPHRQQRSDWENAVPPTGSKTTSTPVCGVGGGVGEGGDWCMEVYGGVWRCMEVYGGVCRWVYGYMGIWVCQYN